MSDNLKPSTNDSIKVFVILIIFNQVGIPIDYSCVTQTVLYESNGLMEFYVSQTLEEKITHGCNKIREEIPDTVVYSHSEPEKTGGSVRFFINFQAIQSV